MNGFFRGTPGNNEGFELIQRHLALVDPGNNQLQQLLTPAMFEPTIDLELHLEPFKLRATQLNRIIEGRIDRFLGMYEQGSLIGHAG